MKGCAASCLRRLGILRRTGLIAMTCLVVSVTAHGENIMLENHSIRMEIDPTRGARVFRLSVASGSNLAHPDYGFFSDHPLVEQWDAFRRLSYTVIKTTGHATATFKASRAGLELTKTVSLNGDKPSVTLSYTLANSGAEPIVLHSAFASFLTVADSRDASPTLAYTRSATGKTGDPVYSTMNAYKVYPGKKAETLDAFVPKGDVSIQVTPDRSNFREFRVGAASGSYLSLEQHYDFGSLAPGKSVSVKTVYDFHRGGAESKTVQGYLAKWDQRRRSYRAAVEKPITPPYPDQALGISGAFYSVWDVAATISADENAARKEMEAMHRAGMDLVIFETGSSAGVAYRSRFFKTIPACENTIDHLVAAAQESGVKFFLSLPAINSNPYLLNNDELAGFNKTIRNLAAELYEKYGKNSAFTGWYIPFEINDSMIQEAPDRNRIARFHHDLAQYLHTLSPGIPVSIAPYFTTDRPPQEFETIWKEFLDQAGIHILMMQDSVGALNVSQDAEKRLKLLPPFLAALHRACAASGVELWMDLEAFRQVHGAPIDGATWSAVPADFDRVRRQLQIESPFVNKIVTYEFAHYFSPNGLIPALAGGSHELYHKYLQYRIKPISGTFYQPTNGGPPGVGREKWNAMFAEMKALGMDTFILQWIVNNDEAFYRTDLPWMKREGSDDLGMALEMAGKWNMKVIVGLDFSSEWWKSKPGYLKEVAARNEDIIREIKAKYLPNPHFTGWYIPQEISNYTSTLPALKPEIRQFFIATARVRDAETPGKSLSTAPFFNATVQQFSPADQYASWWRDVAADTGLNIIMMQDGIGAHPVPMDTMRRYFISLNRELKGTGIEVWSDLEIFSHAGRGRRRRLEPAAISRVRDQIFSESLLVKKIVCFAYPNYAFAGLGPSQRVLHDAYKNFIEPVLSPLAAKERK